MTDYRQVLARLRGHAEEDYRIFQSRLLKNDAINVLGVRTPVLRALAREWKGEWETILTFPDSCYEITFLKCAVLSLLPFKEFSKHVDDMVGRLDNWATCDCFRARCIARHREEFLPFLRRYLADGREFVRRYALVSLLHDYVSREYLPVIFQFVLACGDEMYYVSMASAWLIAEVLVKFYEDCIVFLRTNRLSPAIQNRAIRKARESFRLSAEQKEELKALRK